MATENNKNIKYDVKSKVLSNTKKVSNEVVKTNVKNVFTTFINALKLKHL